MASDETPKPTQTEESAAAISDEQKKSSDGNAVATTVEKDGSDESKTVAEGDSAAKDENNAEGESTELKEYEKRALIKIKALVEDAILANKIFNNNNNNTSAPKTEEEKDESTGKEPEQKEKSSSASAADQPKEKNEKAEEAQPSEVKEGETDKGKETEPTTAKEEEKPAKDVEEVDKDVSLWGVPLLPSKGDKATDVVLMKFLRAKEFKVDEAFEMLKTTLQWRKQMKIDSVLEEDFGPDLNSAAYISGVDREGHPVCYNIYGVFGNEEIYNKTLGTEEGREKFLRWRSQIMEKGIRMLDFQPGGVSSLVQISDLKNTPGPARKELRLATKQDVGILQDNYPELVARNIFINVPFWYYAFNALLPPLLTPKNKNKFVFVRPAKVTETLLKYLTPQEIPVQYGGLKRENDNDFSVKDEVQELSLKGSSTDTIEIPAPEAGSTLVWEFTVFGWDVEYKEEFVPEDPNSYTIIVHKERTINWQEDSVRNSFTARERGKVVISIENGSFKKKRVLYRFKAKDSSASSSTN